MCIYCYFPIPWAQLHWQTTTYDLKLHLIFIKCTLCSEKKRQGELLQDQHRYIFAGVTLYIWKIIEVQFLENIQFLQPLGALWRNEYKKPAPGPSQHLINYKWETLSSADVWDIQRITIQEKWIRTWTFCTPDHMESELILFQLQYSQMRGCCCQCEKPEPQFRLTELLIYYKPSKLKGESNLILGPEPSLSYWWGSRQLPSWSNLMRIAVCCGA